MSTTAPWFAETLTLLLEGKDLDAERMSLMVESIIEGKCGDVETAALLIALRTKGETADELAAAATVLRGRMIRMEVKQDVLDTCGTGGDASGTFNISTATAFVVAAAGVPVVKHGNRAVSSQSGSADVLTLLGIPPEANPLRVQRWLDDVGLAFCFAPHFHPALAQVAPVRRRLQVRTLFNCLGPLANPAGAPYQLLGVGRREWLEPMAGALSRLGTRHAFLVSAGDGLDEISLGSVTSVREVRPGQVTELEWTPDDFGLAPCSVDDLRAEGPEASAATVQAVLAGEDGPALRVVLANAAAALLVAERVGTLAEGVKAAREAIASGKARQVLEKLRSGSTERAL